MAEGDNAISGYPTLLYNYSGAYGNQWQTFTLPENPADGEHLLVYNSDANEARVYFRINSIWWIQEVTEV